MEAMIYLIIIHYIHNLFYVFYSCKKISIVQILRCPKKKVYTSANAAFLCIVAYLPFFFLEQNISCIL